MPRWKLTTILLLSTAVLTLALWRVTHPPPLRASSTTHVSPSSGSVPPHPLSIGQFLVLPRRPAERMNYLISGVTPEYSGYGCVALIGVMAG